MKIKVLHFISHGRIGGQERAMFQLFRAFKNDPEIDFAVATGEEGGLYMEKIRELAIPLIPLKSGSGFTLHVDPGLIQQLRLYPIHHFHDPSPNQVFPSLLCGKQVIRLLTRRGGPIDYRKHGLKKALKFRINRYLYRHYFHGFSGNTGVALRFIDEYLGIGGRKFLLYNGIDFALLAPREDLAAVRERWGVSPADFTVGTACHLLNWKRVDLLIRAFHRARIPSKKLLIFGQGVEERKLRKLVDELGIPDQVRFAGEIPHTPDGMQVLDCYVQASGPEESFGNAVVEAMYLKIPSLIMKDGGGMREHIDHGMTGWVAEDETDLVRLLEELHSNPTVAAEIAARASIHVQNKYDLSRMVHSYKEFYDHVLASEKVKG